MPKSASHAISNHSSSCFELHVLDILSSCIFFCCLLYRSVSLNGNVLKMTADDRLPDITPVSGSDSVEMPPYSYVFIILTRANVKQCMR